MAITDEQRAALHKLAVALPSDWYLAGGVAVASYFDHRTSLDLDLFAFADPLVLVPVLDKLAGVVVTNRSAGTLQLRVDGVPVSLLEYRYAMLEAPRTTVLAVPVASITDLACMKLSAIAGRGAARDFWDLHTIITTTHRPLAQWLDDFTRKYPVEDLGHVVRSLAYFDDAEAAPFPAGLDRVHWATMRADFERWVRDLM